jgi:hypothetical protein
MVPPSGNLRSWSVKNRPDHRPNGFAGTVAPIRTAGNGTRLAQPVARTAFGHVRILFENHPLAIDFPAGLLTIRAPDHHHTLFDRAMIDPQQPVRVYWNYKHRCYSIFQGGAVRASARQVQLEDVTFRVRESGRQRMLREKRKVIHAFAIGRLVDFVHPSETRKLSPFSGTRIAYDPYRFPSFVDTDTHEPVLTAKAVRFDEEGTRAALAERLAA